MADDNGLKTMSDSDVATMKNYALATDQANTSLKGLSDTLARSNSFLNAFGDTTSKLKYAMDNLSTSYSGFMNNVAKVGHINEQQINQFGLLTNGLIGVRAAFSGVQLEGAGFSEQLKYLTYDIQQNGGAIAKLAGFAKTLGHSIPIEKLKTGGAALMDYVERLALSADNAARLQKEFIALSAQTGNLGRVFSAAGPELKGLNEIVNRQSDYINAASRATLLSAEHVEKYYMELGKIPGAFESMIHVTETSGKTMNMLTAAIKLSQGTGRDFKEIVSDLTVAFKNYGLVGEDALKFSARMGEVANNLGVDLQTVTSNLTSAAGAFARFADVGEKSARMAEGLAKATNEYVQALKATGMSGTHALDVMRGMEDAIAGMNIQQKAFLSAQTGGPGGLMGAFQIEKMMRDGDFTGVLTKMRDQMRQQLGNIVTLDEASSNQGAAAQLTRQIQIMKSGPLGSMVKSDQDAYRMLEAMKGLDTGKIKPGALKEDILGDSIDKGTKIQEKMGTDISVMRSIMESTQRTAGVINYGLATESMGAKNSTKTFMREGAAGGGADVDNYAAAVKSGLVGDTRSASVIKNIQNFKSFYNNLSTNMSETVSHLQAALVTPNDKKALAAEVENLRKQIEIEKAKMKALPKEKQAAARKAIVEEERLLDQAKAVLGANMPPIGGAESFQVAGEVYSPGGGLKSATSVAVRNRMATAGTPGGADNGLMTADRPIPVSGALDVRITGYCINCGDRLEDEQAKAVLPINGKI
jgi:hypothetical protein